MQGLLLTFASATAGEEEYGDVGAFKVIVGRHKCFPQP